MSLEVVQSSGSPRHCETGGDTAGTDSSDSVALNGRRYRRPIRPTVVVCVDGFDPTYLDHGLVAGILPAMASFARNGFGAIVDAVMPTFTNPNNLSIITGAPPAVHGISGNYYLDRETGAEVMITDASLVRSGTILGALSRIGVRAAAVTAKDKLRAALGHDLDGICFSSEHAGACTLAGHGVEDVEALVGRPTPDRYSGDLSLFVLDAGIRLLETGQAELLYLSLSDYVQHKHAPGTPEADIFLRQLDARLARLAALGATVAVTADHGMNDKSYADGRPHVVFLEDEIADRFGAGSVRVICPITDPFVRHHGALGSFVRVHVRGDAPVEDVLRFIRGLPTVEIALDCAEACARFELPADREADIVVVARPNAVLGARREDHDLSALAGRRLRSHGGLSEQPVPFLLSHPLRPEYRLRAASRRLRNFDVFDFALNGVV